MSYHPEDSNRLIPEDGSLISAETKGREADLGYRISECEINLRTHRDDNSPYSQYLDGLGSTVRARMVDALEQELAALQDLDPQTATEEDVKSIPQALRKQTDD